MDVTPRLSRRAGITAGCGRPTSHLTRWPAEAQRRSASPGGQQPTAAASRRRSRRWSSYRFSWPSVAFASSFSFLLLLNAAKTRLPRMVPLSRSQLAPPETLLLRSFGPKRAANDQHHLLVSLFSSSSVSKEL